MRDIQRPCYAIAWKLQKSGGDIFFQKGTVRFKNDYTSCIDHGLFEAKKQESLQWECRDLRRDFRGTNKSEAVPRQGMQYVWQQMK